MGTPIASPHTCPSHDLGNWMAKSGYGPSGAKRPRTGAQPHPGGYRVQSARSCTLGAGQEQLTRAAQPVGPLDAAGSSSGKPRQPTGAAVQRLPATGAGVAEDWESPTRTAPPAAWTLGLAGQRQVRQ